MITITDRQQEFDLNMSIFVAMMYIVLYMTCHEYELVYNVENNPNTDITATECTINYVNEDTITDDTYTGVATLDDKTTENVDTIIDNNSTIDDLKNKVSTLLSNIHT